MSYLIDLNKKNITYNDLSKSYLSIDLPDEKSLIGKSDIRTLIYDDNTIDNDLVNFLSYNSKISYVLSKILPEKISNSQLDKLYNEVEMPLLYVLYNMEKIGIEVDLKYLDKYDKKLDLMIDKLTEDILKLAGVDFNINSPKQLQEILFDKLKLDYERKKVKNYLLLLKF